MKWLWLTAVVILLDQITKQASEAMLVLHQPVAAIDGVLNFTLLYNEGAAFSFLSDAGGWQRWFFMVLSAGISIFLFMWLKKLEAGKTVLALGLALILGGAIGNLIDRSLFGHVIDFIQVYYHAGSCLPGFSTIQYTEHALCVWPAFNIADSAIFVGAACLIIDMFTAKEDNHA